ncbi:PAS domain-containing sensor histidine kinase [Geotalea sp. SG265]|uniref:sensor histidine kinase n=1 Tax=Geotalea sp. SG265 TaxID=2922867 RepID=UPI001FAE7A6E|nr:PAS domain-containing sensor histidine kinase [Geotalea sp. SG265]
MANGVNRPNTACVKVGRYSVLIWTFSVSATAVALISDIERLALLENSLSLLVLWLVGMGGIYLGSRRLRRSEERLHLAEQALFRSNQNLEMKVMERTAELERANQRLKGEIEERLRTEAKLRASEIKYRIVADNTYGWEFWQDPEGRFVYSSPACREITGRGAEEFLADQGLFNRIIFPDDLKCYDAHRREVEEGRWTNPVAFRIIKPDGSLCWIGHICRPIYDEDGNFIGIRGSNRDISDRKRAEDEIRLLNEELEGRVLKRTAQLEASNRELEGFCYAISHDLRAPLTRLEGYSRALLEDCCESLDNQGRAYAECIQRNSIQLKEVIDILLELTMLTRGDLQVEEVNLSEMCLAIMEDLQLTYAGRIIQWLVAPEVAAKGDKRLLMLALRNLLDNACKYTAKHQQATIEFGVVEHKKRRVYFIRDDGAGFDMKFAKKLFKPFERMHHPEEFSGLGIGLATVQRIIHRHGGRIWAEGEIEKGATFFFNL